MTAQAQISMNPPRTLLMRIGEWWSKRKYGAVLDPGRAIGHNTTVMLDYLRFERRVERWKTCDTQLSHLAVMAAAARIGCSWCLDFGYWESEQRGIAPAKARAVPDWRAHREVFSDLELLVLDYADAMTATPPQVSDVTRGALLAALGEPAFVELTTLIALENLRSRANTAYGLTGQGFSDRCAVPLRAGDAG
jgi:alkylhydroperoxidase family enzyme